MRLNLFKSYSTKSSEPLRAQSSEKSGFVHRCRGIFALIALATLCAAHLALNGNSSTSGMTATLWKGHEHLAATHMHRADWMGDLIDAIDEILDALDGIDPDDDAESGEGEDEDGGEDGGGGDDADDEEDDDDDEQGEATP